MGWESWVIVCVFFGVFFLGGGGGGAGELHGRCGGGGVKRAPAPRRRRWRSAAARRPTGAPRCGPPPLGRGFEGGGWRGFRGLGVLGVVQRRRRRRRRRAPIGREASACSEKPRPTLSGAPPPQFPLNPPHPPQTPKPSLSHLLQVQQLHQPLLRPPLVLGREHVAHVAAHRLGDVVHVLRLDDRLDVVLFVWIVWVLYVWVGVWVYGWGREDEG